jgi:hypothetical protein
MWIVIIFLRMRTEKYKHKKTCGALVASQIVLVWHSKKKVAHGS